MRTLTFGPYIVRESLRPDNPAFPVFLIYRGDKLIGKSFSVPDLGCCQWLEQQERDRIRYAKESAQLRVYTVVKGGKAANAERPATEAVKDAA